jgi:MFS transporter, MFS domain-containing protein family, molybdate-anion transporter
MYSYVASLLLFLILLGGAAYWQHHHHLAGRLSLIKPDGSEELDAIDDELHDIDSDSTSNRYFQFLNRFFLGHGLATAADWLQVRIPRP